MLVRNRDLTEKKLRGENIAIMERGQREAREINNV